MLHPSLRSAPRTMALHDGQEFHDNLGARANEYLAFAGSVGVVDWVQSIVQDTGARHGEADSSGLRGDAEGIWKVEMAQAIMSVTV